MRTENNYICSYCGRKFPLWYWGVTGRAGGFGEIIKPGLAKANFKRHKRACKSNNYKKLNLPT